MRPLDLIDQLTFREDGSRYLVPCVDVTAYFRGKFLDHAEGLLDCYQQGLALLKDRFTYYQTDSDKTPRKVRPDTLDLLATWVKSQRKILIYHLILTSGEKRNDLGPWALIVKASGLTDSGYVRVTLPLEFVNPSPAPLLELTRALLGALPFVAAYAGYSVLWDRYGPSETMAIDRMSELAPEYPGIDLNDPNLTDRIVERGIKCVNWLTFLDNALCQRLGGIEQLIIDLGADIPVHRLSSGIIIRAGVSPMMKDGLGGNLAPYRRVGRIVAPVRAGDHPRFLRSKHETIARLAR